MEKIEWNVVQLGTRDFAKVNLKVALDSLQTSKVVGFPTDTVYGFGVDAERIRAVRKLYNITDRDYGDPLPICLGEVEYVTNFADVDDLPHGLLTELLPGAVTIILKKRPNVLPDLNPGFETIGIRVPGPRKKIFIRKVINRLKNPIALVGAREQGKPHSMMVDDFEDIRNRAYVVYDGGELDKKRVDGSTVIDLSMPGRYRILRPGCMQDAVVSIVTRHKLDEFTEIKDEDM